MNLPYTGNIPNPPHTPATDVPDMQTNTNSVETWPTIDHFGFVDINGGRHKWVQIQSLQSALTSIPAPTGGLSGTEGTLFTNTVSSRSELFYTPDLTSNIYQLTRGSVSTFSLCSANDAYGAPPAGFTQIGGWTFLPGARGAGSSTVAQGMLYQYGFYGKAGATGSSGIIQFPRTFTNVPFSIQLTLYRTSGNQSISVDSSALNVPTTTSFHFLTSSSGSDGIYWIAIGT